MAVLGGSGREAIPDTFFERVWWYALPTTTTIAAMVAMREALDPEASIGRLYVMAVGAALAAFVADVVYGAALTS